MSIVRTAEEVKEEFAKRGISVSLWAREMGYSPALVHQVLSGKLKCSRGQAHDIAVIFGLKNGLVSDVRNLPFSTQEGCEKQKESN